jgi:hypothetical protein
MRKLRRSIVAVACGAALFTAGVALADNPGHPNNGQGTTATGALVTTTTVSTSTSTLPSQAKGYGFYCQWASKKHVAGQKGTPFSQCVIAMAKAAHGASFKAACAGMSKTHVAGQKGTLFSQCVSAAAKQHANH